MEKKGPGELQFPGDFLPVPPRSLGGRRVGRFRNLHLTLVPFKAFEASDPWQIWANLLLSSKVSCFRSQHVGVPGPPRNFASPWV